MKKLSFIFCLSLLLLNCQKDDDNPENNAIPEQETCNMQFDDLGLTEANSVFYAEQAGWSIDDTPWIAKYTDTSIELSFEGNCGAECGAKVVYVFNKIDSCINYNYSYTIFIEGGGIYNYNRITESFIEYDFIIQEYDTDEKFVGRLSYTSQGVTYNIDFWIDFTENDYFIQEVPEYISFQDCLASQMSYNIDVNNDNTPDFLIDYSEETIQYQSYEVPFIRSEMEFISSNQNNKILGYIDNSTGNVFGSLQTTRYGPISSENFDAESETCYIGEYHDFISESEYPYKQYNLWTGPEWNIYENPGVLSDWYVIVKMILNGESHYGYINFSISGNDCEIVIHETYLNPTPNEHIVIE